MKKLLVLALVCALASVANATLNLSIVDNLDGTFGIQQTGTFTARVPPNSDGSYFYAVADMGGTIPTGGVVAPGAPGNTYMFDDAQGGGLPDLGNNNGVWGNIDLLIASGADVAIAGGLYISGITAAPGVTVYLYTCDPDMTAGTLIQTVTLVPEPMTLGLLALGGLFIRRK